MKLGDMVHCKMECRARMTPTRQGPDPRVIVFCPGMLNRIAASLDSEKQNSFETVLQKWNTGLGMLSFICAWEDMSCMIELKMVAGLITK